MGGRGNFRVSELSQFQQIGIAKVPAFDPVSLAEAVGLFGSRSKIDRTEFSPAAFHIPYLRNW